MDLTLFVREGCHLCEEAERLLKDLQPRYPHQLQLVDIATDDALLEQYRFSIPVLRAGGRDVPAPLTRDRVERALREAAAS